MPLEDALRLWLWKKTVQKTKKWYWADNRPPANDAVACQESLECAVMWDAKCSSSTSFSHRGHFTLSRAAVGSIWERSISPISCGMTNGGVHSLLHKAPRAERSSCLTTKIYAAWHRKCPWLPLCLSWARNGQGWARHIIFNPTLQALWDCLNALRVFNLVRVRHALKLTWKFKIGAEVSQNFPSLHATLASSPQ